MIGKTQATLGERDFMANASRIVQIRNSLISSRPLSFSLGLLRGIPARNVFWVGMCIGVLLRFYVFAGGRMLWLDESMIALSLMTRTSTELLQPLNFLQMAPIGWLWANQAVLEISGNVDYGLRTIALLAGLGALGMFGWLSRNLYSLPVSACLMLAFAVSGLLVRYSVELKPYGTDVFFTLAIVTLIWLILENRNKRSRLYIAALALAGLVAVLSSFPAVYVLGGCVGIAIVKLFLDRRRLDAVLLICAASIWLIVFVFLMKSVYISQADGAGFSESGIQSFLQYDGIRTFSADQFF